MNANEYFMALVFISEDRLKTRPLGRASLSIRKRYDPALIVVSYMTAAEFTKKVFYQRVNI